MQQIIKKSRVRFFRTQPARGLLNKYLNAQIQYLTLIYRDIHVLWFSSVFWDCTFFAKACVRAVGSQSLTFFEYIQTWC